MNDREDHVSKNRKFDLDAISPMVYVSGKLIVVVRKSDETLAAYIFFKT